MIGVIVGRFQVPYLHPGHLNLIATSLRENLKTIIFLGYSTVSKDEKNPYDIGERGAMIRKIFPQIEIFPIKDRESDAEWSKELDNLITLMTEDDLPFSERYQDVVLYHSRDSFKEKYSGNYKLKEIPEVEGYSGTKLRNQQT